MLLALRARFAPRHSGLLRRAVSTLPNNPEIKVFDNPTSPASYLLTYLSTTPPSPRLAIGTSSTLPPTPSSFRENPSFTSILHDVVTTHGHEDPDVLAQAQALASPGGSPFTTSVSNRRRNQPDGGASSQGGAGGAGVGGWVHLSDRRNPPDFGRIAWPEDILGSVQVGEAGQVVGKLQASGTYRVITNEGILGLSPFMQEKLIQRLRREEANES